MKLHNLGCADLFRCVFCRDLVKKPKMMSCMHTACFDCLEKNFNDSKVICKACEAVNSVKSVDKFVDQNYVRNIMDIVESSQKSEVCLAKCVDCDVDICENNMLFTCLTCSESSPNDDHDSAHSNFVPLLTNEKPTARYLMCINCFDHHCLQNPSHKVFACCATMDPSLLSDSDSRRALCPKHKHPVLSFCVKQGKAMCTSCLKSHKSADDHEHLTGIQLKALVKSKVDCGKRFHDNIRNFNSRIKEFKRDLEREKRTHIDNTQQLFAKLHEILRENEKQILSKISTAYDSKFADLEETETRGQYYEHLGDRLAQTASDLLCLSSEEENFAFASSLDLLVTQLPAFCGDIEEDLRRKLKGKPVLSLDKKTFEDFKKAQYVSVEEQEVKFADSICCTITDSEQSRMTLITLTSDLMHSKYAHNNNNAIDTGDFKVELTLTGKAPITIPVEKTEDVSVEESGEETNSTKFVACIDPDVVAAGVYRLSISYRGEKVKSPEVVNIFSKYDSDKIANSLEDRIEESLMRLSVQDKAQDTPFKQLEDYLNELERSSPELDETETAVADSFDDDKVTSVSRQHSNISFEFQQKTRRLKESAAVFNEFEEDDDDVSSVNITSIARETLRKQARAAYHGVPLSNRPSGASSSAAYQPTGFRPTSKTSSFVSASQPEVFPKPEPPPVVPNWQPFGGSASQTDFPSSFQFGSNGDTQFGSRSRNSAAPQLFDPSFPAPTEKRGMNSNRQDSFLIQTQYNYANKNPNSKRFIGHVSLYTSSKNNGAIYFSSGYKDLLFTDKDVVYGPKSPSGQIKIRMSDNVMCRVVFENDIGFARDIWVLPFSVDSAQVAKCIPHFVGSIVCYDPSRKRGVIENMDGFTLDFDANAVMLDENNSRMQIQELGYSGEVLFNVKFAKGVFISNKIQCLRAT